MSATDATRDDVQRLESAPVVEKILDELGVESLPGPDRIEKRHVDDDGEVTNGELVAWRIPIRNYGTLVAMGHDDEIGALFLFDSDTSKAPSGYSKAEAENAALGVSGSDVVFSRNATPDEREHVLSVLDLDGEISGANVEAKTHLDGFHVSASVSDSDGNDPEMHEFVVEVGEFDPREQELADVTTDVSSLSASELEVSEVGTQVFGPIRDPRDVLRDVVADWIVGTFASETLDYLGVECNTTCPDCVWYIVNVVGACRSCVPLCSSGASGVGAILCVACFFLFCNDTESQVDCLACLVCLYEGEEPDTMDTNALRWVLDEIRDTPSFPL
ncbi:hypothetical protein [Natrarchaeobaculum sulfurireducens]|nr:hypothetical protein [Natrarchaeobaculum sulfurireducens]